MWHPIILLEESPLLFCENNSYVQNGWRVEIHVLVWWSCPFLDVIVLGEMENLAKHHLDMWRKRYFGKYVENYTYMKA